MTASIPTSQQPALANLIPRWQPATWEDYLRYRDDPNPEITRLFFNGKYLFVDMGNEGINHASVNNLFAVFYLVYALFRTNC
ncbi:hypothetical protein [Coleofasciculus sp. H7-2]|uniref:hypothetical protein n=1 Tax=Coleofasciculus sp. H7-2 TaxID=3351545 RepID=UPI00366BE32B